MVRDEERDYHQECKELYNKSRVLFPDVVIKCR